KTVREAVSERVNDEIMDNVRLPKFNTLQDKVNGLTILIHDVWSVDITLTQYQLIDRQYEGKLQITIIDHFGLDDNDVSQAEGKGFHYLAGFRSWYILQHYSAFAYRPFLTKIYLDV